MKRKILLIGKNGQVGRQLCSLLPSLGDVTALERQQLDLSQPEQIRQLIRSLTPEIIVNAAAYTAVDRAESVSAETSAPIREAPNRVSVTSSPGNRFCTPPSNHAFDVIVELWPAEPTRSRGCLRRPYCARYETSRPPDCGKVRRAG